MYITRFANSMRKTRSKFAQGLCSGKADNNSKKNMGMCAELGYLVSILESRIKLRKVICNAQVRQSKV